jgi:hypothetical protein
MAQDEEPRQTRLEVYKDKSVFVDEEGRRQVYAEGPPSPDSKLRQARIQQALAAGYIDTQIRICKSASEEVQQADDVACDMLSRLVDSVTEQFGRAIVGLLFLQLAIKAIEPTQSIRLHKSGQNADDFSWADGISMRTLDKQFSTPALRANGLLSLNADGCLMTRSLAENYPYTRLYKAAIRGSKEEWLSLLDRVESGQSDARACLHFLIGLLVNRSAAFQENARAALEHVERVAAEVVSVSMAADTLLAFCESSSHAARIFEVAIHSLCQVVIQHGGYEGVLKPLSQMRSANKKHGNVGDVEVLERPGGMRITISWDAKYGKTYLRDEIDELEEKLHDHPETRLAGFITDAPPDQRKEIVERVRVLESAHGLRVEIVDFRSWAEAQAERVPVSNRRLAREWLVAFAECICQKRRDIAPIDEPADVWVRDLRSIQLSR